jgi:hypothetical protein
MAKAEKPTAISTFDTALLDAGADDALTALGRAGERAEALVDAWVKAGNAAAVGVAADQAGGKARKAARRGMNVLKSRGIKPPVAPRVVSVTGGKGEEKLEGWLLPPDTNGVTLFAVTASTPASRYRVVFAFVQPEVGVIRATSGEVSQTDLKDSFQRASRGAYRAVRVPVEYARFRIAAARKKQKDRGVAETLGFASGENLLEGAPSEVEHPFDAEGLELADEDAQELAAKSGLLHQLPEFASWLPEKTAVDELLAKVGETLTPGAPPDQVAFEASLKEQVLAATDRYFTPERRAQLVLSMKDSALGVLARDGEARALDVVATMKAIEKAGLITDPPRDVPFLRAFFEKAIAVLLAQGNGQLRVPIPRGAAAPVEVAPPAEAAAFAEAAPPAEAAPK